MAKYKVKNTSILHNGKVYAEGSTLELSENQAKRLEDFVDLVPETATKTPSQTKPQTNKTKSETKTQAKTKAETKTETVKQDGEGSDNNGGSDNDK